MNPIDDQLSRLFRAARTTSEAVAVPFGAETRLLAAWRQRRPVLPTLWDTALLLRGLAAAGIIMLASFLPALSSAWHATPFADLQQLTDSTLSADESP